ncbi:MAG: CDP-diacylglycerol--serine O-phosphatidyltransferase [Alphaproteobacteria bacterium]|nr:CDP-diacylglycerol--serine O-phosphatidyltransferase [Alphaproteobacteria bacterium]
MPVKKKKISAKTASPKKQKSKLLSIGYILPSLITLISVALSMTAILAAIQGQFAKAMVLMVFATVCDGLDGRLARAFKSTSKFGGELDSLADNTSFGVAPAIIIFFWSTYQIGSLGWAISIIFAACITLRLARFNVMTDSAKAPAYWDNYFTGIPAPAGGLLALMPIALYRTTGEALFSDPRFCAALMLFIALMLVSRVPTLSLKKVHIDKALAPFALIAMLLLILSSVLYFWYALVVVGALYIASIPLTAMGFMKKKQQYLKGVKNDR